MREVWRRGRLRWDLDYVLGDETEMGDGDVRPWGRCTRETIIELLRLILYNADSTFRLHHYPLHLHPLHRHSYIFSSLPPR